MFPKSLGRQSCGLFPTRYVTAFYVAPSRLLDLAANRDS